MTDLATLQRRIAEHQRAADALIPERDRAIRAAVAARGVRPVARELGLSATAVSRIARKEQS